MRTNRESHGHDSGSTTSSSGVAPGKSTLSERIVQRRAAGGPGATSDAEVQALAEHGTAGGGGSLPFLDVISQSFGAEHDLSGVQAHVGGAAAEAADGMGALAYASGNHVAFGESPSLHTAAHEAAHVVQQRAGVQLKGAVGEVGDSYEHNADAVADRVVAGKSAADLLPAGGGGSSSAAGPVQRYTKVSGSGMPYDTVSDDGKLAVVDHGREAWAESSMIASSNAILDQHHSKAKIEELSAGGVTVVPPGAKSGTPGTALKKFRMVDRAAGGEVELVDDCGGANQQMLGSEHHGKEEFVAANNRGTTQEFTGPSTYKADDNATGGIVSTTEKLSGEIYIRIMEREFGKKLNRVDALAAWDALGADEKKRLSKKYGINQFAAPKVGQGITIGSERDMPGASETGYNFHFALNLMMSGSDYITLEDYDSSGVKYYFDMYGPASKNQSFAEDPGNANAVDDKSTTMVVEHSESLNGTCNDAKCQLVDSPEGWENPRYLAVGDKLSIQRKGMNWMKVSVVSGKHAGDVGWILNQYFTNN